MIALAAGGPPLDGWYIPVVDSTLVGGPRAGPVALRILDGMYQGAATMADAGVHFIFDDIVWERPAARTGGPCHGRRPLDPHVTDALNVRYG